MMSLCDTSQTIDEEVQLRSSIDTYVGVLPDVKLFSPSHFPR